MALPRFTDDTTQFWQTYFNDILLPEIEALAGGGGSVSPAVLAFLGQGRFATDADGNAIAPEASPTPALATVLPAGLRLLQADGTIHTLAEDVTLTGAPASSTLYPTVAVAYDEGSETYTYTPTWHTTREPRGSGTLAKVTTTTDTATLETGAAYSDVILSLGALIQLIYDGASGAGSGTTYWQALAASAADPTTLTQYIAAQIEDAVGIGQGASVIPAEVRDEVMVNTLHNLALHQMSVDNAFSNVSPHHAIVVSPGRGVDAWSYDELTDAALTDMPVSTESHYFGSEA